MHVLKWLPLWVMAPLMAGKCSLAREGFATFADIGALARVSSTMTRQRRRLSMKENKKKNDEMSY